jgi:hypothetical protein
MEAELERKLREERQRGATYLSLGGHWNTSRTARIPVWRRDKRGRKGVGRRQEDGWMSAVRRQQKWLQSWRDETERL